jgi:hypothetical protein
VKPSLIGEKSMPKIRTISPTFISGKICAAGKVFEASKEDARALITAGKAVPVGGKAEKAENREDDVAENTSTKAKK